jgi:serine/threonine protein kinase
LTLQPGTIIDGRFQVINQVGLGGMGIVYRAMHLGMHREVAMKVLKSDLKGDNIKLQRFRREAQVISVLEHPNIVQIYAVGMITDGQPYIAMEFLAGEQLSDVIKKDGRMKWRDAIPLFMQICDALEYAHQMKIIHRDIKPSNIILLDDKKAGCKNVKLVDFGIAKSLTDAGPALTQTEMVVGSVFYLSPGQFQGRAADPRSDIYALACTFFEVLTGVPPYRGDTAFETVAMAMSEAIPSVNDAAQPDTVPSDLDYLIRWMLHKESEKRPESIGVVKEALQKISCGERIIRPVQASEPVRKAHKPPKKLAATILSIVLVAIGIAALMQYQRIGHGGGQGEEESTLTESLRKARDSRAPDLFKRCADLMNYYLRTGRPLEAHLLARKAIDSISENYPPSQKYEFLLAQAKACYAVGQWSDVLFVHSKAQQELNNYDQTKLQTIRLIAAHTFANAGSWGEVVVLLQPTLPYAFQGGAQAPREHWETLQLGAIALASLGNFVGASACADNLLLCPDPAARLDAQGILFNCRDATTGSADMKNDTQNEYANFIQEVMAVPEKSARVGPLRSCARIATRHHDVDLADRFYQDAVNSCDKNFEGANIAKSILEEWYAFSPRSKRAPIKAQFEAIKLQIDKYHSELNDRSAIKVPIEVTGVN